MPINNLLDRAHERCRSLRLDDLEREGIYRPAQLFFPVITYPPPVGLPRWSEKEMFADRLAFDAERLTLYVHIPFCLSRCTFCHWVVTLHSDEDQVERYLKGLDREFTRFKALLGVTTLRPRSILIGGGTPTYPVAHQIDAYLNVIRRHVDLSKCQQFSVEAEPSTLIGPDGDDRLRVLAEHGVNRVSMGVQAFDDAILKSLGRIHDTTVARRAITRLHAAGIPSVSIDLIYGLPNQTLECWADTMRTAAQSGADAWQLYRLRILPHGDKPGKIVDQYKRQQARFPNIDDVVIMKMVGWEVSREHGFEQHYTRIFARRPEDISEYLHDVNDGLYDVAGFGISSWSSIGRTFSQNVGNDFKRYYELVEGGQLPVDRGFQRDDDDELRRAFILPLKNTRVDLAAFRTRFGADVTQTVLGPVVADSLRAELIESDGRIMRLTERGRFFADEVCMRFFPDKHLPARDLVHASVDD